jgi:hypothetical protein
MLNLDVFYNRIVHALCNAAFKTIDRTPSNALRAFWNEELDKLKQDSIFWHSMWLNAGRPSAGTLHHIKCSVKARYKAAIRDALCYVRGKTL